MEPLFFFFGESSYTEVKLKMTFEGLKGKNSSIAEFNEFMMCIEEIHNMVVINTQPEYHRNNTISIMNNSAILDYHKLHIEQLCRKNPFEILLTFQIVQGGIAPYWILIKILVKMCKKYGQNTKDLLATLAAVESEFIELYRKYYSIIPFSRELSMFNDENKLYDKISSSATKLLTNRDFSVYYNAFCKTTISLTDFISYIGNESNDDTIDFLFNE